jgi:hypothetical protein
MITFSVENLLLVTQMHESHPALPNLALAASISCLIPVIVGTIRWKALSRELRVVLTLLAFYVPFLVVQILLSFHGIKNLWMGDVYELLQFGVLSTVFALWTREEKVRRAMKSSISIGTILWLIGKFSIEPLGGLSPYSAAVFSLILISMALYTLITLLRSELELLFRRPQFWISAGVVIYLAGTLPLFILSNRLLSLPLEEYEKVWNINWGLGIVSNLVYAVAFLCASAARPMRDVTAP